MNKLFDLRFVIGLFFLIVGLLLVAYYLYGHRVNHQKVNLVCGGIFIIFGAGMIGLSYGSQDTEEV